MALEALMIARPAACDVDGSTAAQEEYERRVMGWLSRLFGGGSGNASRARVERLLREMCADDDEVGTDTDSLFRLIEVSSRQTAVVEELGAAVVPALTDTLEHSDAKLRRKACWALTVLGKNHVLPGESLAAIGTLGRDSSLEVCEQALLSLGALAKTIDVSPALPPLLAALKHPQPKLRKQTLELVGQLGEKAAIALDGVRALLDDPDVDVAEAARATAVKLGAAPPEAGAGGEIERLARLTASADYSARERAWKELDKLASPQDALEPLMKAFRAGNARAMGTGLTKFVGKAGAERARPLLLEIFEYARRSSDSYTRRYMARSACAALLSFDGGPAALRPHLSTEMLRSVVTHGLLSSDVRNSSSIVAALSPQERAHVLSDLISLFRSAESKDDEAYSVTSALQEFGPDAFDQLLEVYRGVTHGVINEDGSTDSDNRGNDSSPASALVQLPGGIARVRASCPAAEALKILLRAHGAGNSGDPELNAALIELGWIRTVVQSYISQTARDALIGLGQKAHPDLLANLRVEFPSHREWQTNRRKLILGVLRETGDEQCVASIKAVLESDPPVADAAHDAIKGIAGRHPSVDVPPHPGDRPLPIRSIGKSGDDYVDACFRVDFEEFYESRRLQEMPDAMAMAKHGNAGEYTEATVLADRLRGQFPDLDLIWEWSAILQKKQGKLDEARQTIRQGIQAARSKASLCAEMGEVEFLAGSLAEAVKWWIKSVVTQVETKNLHTWTPMLRLSYVANAHGMVDVRDRLLAAVDRIQNVRYNADGANEIYRLTERSGTPAIAAAIAVLDRYYLS